MHCRSFYLDEINVLVLDISFLCHFLILFQMTIIEEYHVNDKNVRHYSKGDSI